MYLSSLYLGGKQYIVVGKTRNSVLQMPGYESQRHHLLLSHFENVLIFMKVLSQF